MNLLTMKNICKAYTDRVLLENADFSIDSGSRTGIIGVNGTGKSTLLRMISGDEQPDKGTLVKGSSVFINYLPQNPEFAADESVFDHVMRAGSERAGGHDIEGEVKTMLGRLGFSNPGVSISALSGGQKKKAALAAALVSRCDILLLDEPTNHLDNYMNEWLEEYLNAFKGAIVLVTHDRYFLDVVCSRIVEIDGAKLYDYDTDYEGFLELKAEREAMALATQDKKANMLRTELAWIQRGARARSTKQKARIDRYDELKNERKIRTEEALEISTLSGRLGKKTIGLHNVSKAYGSNVLIKDFTYDFLRSDRVGILGPNGCGKTTLLKMIVQEISPDDGEVETGDTVRIGYFAQDCGKMDDTEKVIDYVKDKAELIHTADGVVTASQMCEKFLFTGSMQYSKIGKLSGGERRRLYLCRVLMEAPNVLILDEPTNDLDIRTMMILEDYLDSFPGIIIAVSHDRYFLDRIADRMLTFEGNGIIKLFNGSYTDYYLSHKNVFGMSGVSGTETSDEKDGGSASTWKSAPRKLKFTYSEQKEYDTIEQDIEQLEQKLKDIDSQMLTASTDFVRLNALSQEKDSTESELEAKMDRYVFLEELAERINAQK